MEHRKRLLPVKTSRGWEQRTAVVEEENLRESEAEEVPELEENDDAEQDDAVSSSKTEKPYIQMYLGRQKTVAAKKSDIASICSCVVRSPQDHFGKLKLLRAMCSEADPVCAVIVRRIAMVSLTAVFKDITPGYYIRELTSEEKSVKVSKDTRALRDFEQGLVSNYRHFVGLLERYVQAVVGSAGPGITALITLSDGSRIERASLENLAVVATNCMCLLLQNLSHFNYSKQLIHTIVPRLDSKQCKGQLAEVCFKTLKEVFSEHGATETSVEAVRLVNQICKTRRDGRLGATFVEVLLSFNSSDLADAAAAACAARQQESQRKRESRDRLSRKEKKNKKAAAKLDREMLEVQATESRDKKIKLQTELLQSMFSVYFRILKNAPLSHLLPAVLEGLAKYAHLISIDFFTDLFQLLDQIMAMPHLSVRERLHCVQTAFQVMNGQGDMLTVDPRQFYSHLYQCLVELCNTEAQKDVPLAMECMEVMLRKRRQVSVQRVLSFVKRLATISLHQDATTASVTLLEEVKSFMRLYSCAAGLLDADVVTAGVFQPEVGDPEYSHADCTSLWELTLLEKHYDTKVRQHASQIARTC